MFCWSGFILWDFWICNLWNKFGFANSKIQMSDYYCTNFMWFGFCSASASSTNKRKLLYCHFGIIFIFFLIRKYNLKKSKSSKIVLRASFWLLIMSGNKNISPQFNKRNQSKKSILFHYSSSFIIYFLFIQPKQKIDH